MAEQEKVATELALGALKAITNLAEAIALSMTDEGGSYDSAIGMLHRFDEMNDARMENGPLKDMLHRELMSQVGHLEMLRGPDHETDSEL